MTVAAPPADRLWEVDVARTVAIVMMVAYHAAYDVTTLAPQTGVDAFSGGWRALQVATGTSFLLIVGISLMIGNGRARQRGLAGIALWQRQARRALQVLAAALLVSIATFVALGDEYIRFGILHCIALSMFLGPLFARLGLLNVPLGIAAIWLGFWLEDRTFGTPWLMPLGLRPDSELGVDYYPLLPWFGIVLIGLAIGGVLYPKGQRGPLISWLASSGGRLGQALGAPGRRALPIYLVHQLILLPLVALALILVGTEIDFGNL
ncbi:MAG: DUF1624 domain-containing protein [Thermoleophilia bacterium]|nr:DUF1624 domain-containing protein [Thermoleophilia bacterium]MDH3725512.1 DUF1624 domain-containing protein [Thermoleophilia bacterium]